MYIMMYIMRDTFWANKVIGWGFAKNEKNEKKVLRAYEFGN